MYFSSCPLRCWLKMEEKQGDNQKLSRKEIITISEADNAHGKIAEPILGGR
jgi:hypothetical protein